MKKAYFEPEIEIVKFSFSDSILKITPSGNFQTDGEEESVNQRGDDNDQLEVMSAGVLHLPTFLS